MTQNFAEKFIIYWRKKIKLNFTQYPDHIFMEKSKNNIANIFPGLSWCDIIFLADVAQ